MVDFSQFNALKAINRTVDYEVYQIAGEPILKILFAGEPTKPYYSALIRKSGKKIRALQSSRVTPSMARENREDDKGLYAAHIIKGWSGIVDANGKEVPFTSENVLDFLNALPDWIFEDIRRYASDIQNFIEDAIETEVIAKN